MRYMQIIIPSHIHHFPQVSRFIESLKKHCLDLEDVTINIIVSEHEKSAIISRFDNNVKVWSLKELVKDVFNRDIEDETSFLEKVGKYNFQCLKKFVGLYKAANPYALLFDSETLVIRDFKLRDLFDKYFNEERTIFYSDNTDNPHFNNSIYSTVTDNCSNILNTPTGLKRWYLETYNWYFSKDILHAIFTYIEGLYNLNLFDLMVNKFNPIFETPLYNQFIQYNNDKYDYNFVCINRKLEEIMGKDEYEKYKNTKDLPTIFEFHLRALSNDNIVKFFKEFYISRNLQFMKFGLRNEKDYTQYVKKFIEETENIIFLCTYFYLPDIEILGEKLR